MAEKTNGREGLLQDGTTAASPSTATPEASSGPSIDTAQIIDRYLSGEDHRTEQSASMMLYVAVTCCCVSPILFGWAVAFTSPTQSTMEGDAKDGVEPPSDLSVLSSAAYSWYAALLNIGAVLGAFSGAFLNDRFGRKKTLVLTAVPHFIGWLGSALLSDPSLLIVLRVLVGWGVGVGSAVTPVYIGEIATTGLRGALGAANQLSVTVGIFVVNCVGTYIFIEDYESKQFVQWRHMCLLCAAMTLLLGTIMCLPESPKWLAKQGKVEEAKTALRRLRNGDSSIEADAILAEAAQQNSVMPGCTTPADAASGASASLSSYKKSLVIGVGLCVFQQLTGVNAVMMYTAKICEEAGVKNSNEAAMVVMGLQVVLTGVSCILMERLGRRALLLFGSFCMAWSQLALCYYFFAQANGSYWDPSVLALAALAVFILGFSLGLGPIPWLILAELFPTDVRSTASSLATACNWSFSFIICLSFSFLEKAITKQGTFLLFAIICGMCFMFVFTLVPETRGKTVEEVLELLNRPTLGVRTVSLQPRQASGNPVVIVQ